MTTKRDIKTRPQLRFICSNPEVRIKIHQSSRHNLMMYSSADSSNIMKKKGLCAAQGVVYNIIAGRHARSNTGKEIIGSYAKMSSRYVNNVVSTSTFNTLEIKPAEI